MNNTHVFEKTQGNDTPIFEKSQGNMHLACTAPQKVDTKNFYCLTIFLKVDI